MRSILAVCNHPGGANAVIPICLTLINNGYKCHVITSERSSSLFERSEIDFTTIYSQLTIKEINDIFYKHIPDLILLGTSEPEDPKVGRLESIITNYSNRNKIPSLSVLDFWSEYNTRYSLTDELLLDAIPTIICVMDKRAKDEMVSLGFNESKVVVTGNPHWDQLNLIQKNIRSCNVEIIKKKLRVKNNNKILLFLSQPLTDSSKAQNGYTEISVLNDLYFMMNELPFFSNTILCIKLHPRENIDKFNRNFKPVCNNEIIYVQDEIDVYDLAVASDYIVGIYSMLLVEYSLLGMNVVSYQPTQDNKKTIKLGYEVTLVQTIDKLRRKLISPCDKSISKHKIINATKNIINIIEKLI